MMIRTNVLKFLKGSVNVHCTYDTYSVHARVLLNYIRKDIYYCLNIASLHIHNIMTNDKPSLTCAYRN